MDHVDTIRVMLVDDHALLRGGMRWLMTGVPSLSVVAECANSHDARLVAIETQPDIIVLDSDDDSGLQNVPELLEIEYAPQVIVLAGSEQYPVFSEAMRLGVRGVFLKEQPPELLIKAIQQVYRGELWFGRSMMVKMIMHKQQPTRVQSPEARKIALLVEREIEVIRLLAEGLSNRDIANRLHLSASTVRHYFTSIFSKLDVTDRVKLLILAYQTNLVEPPTGSCEVKAAEHP
jgi:DNA-binding NarL/FixJ family response regulator